VPDASFYVPLGSGRFRATGLTAGPWSPDAQHGGPPAALLGAAAEGCGRRDDMTVARVTVEILGSIPVGEVEVEAAVIRPGRSVELVEARMAASGREVAVARVWRLLTTDAPAAPSPDPAPGVGPDGTAAADLGGTAWDAGYLGAVEWRFLRGSFLAPGPSTVWTRLRVPLLPGEDVSPLTRVLAVADSGNGVSGTLDLERWWFINPELTVHTSRLPAGEWVCLDAATTISPGGVGLATSVLSDRDGPVARGAQALLVGARPGASA
jgi:hypothetical protein